MTTKADHIRELYAQGFSVADIAGRVGCLDAYVRVCARQRRSGMSFADKKWREENRHHYNALQSQYRKRRWRLDAEFRQRVVDANRRRRERLRAEGVPA